jgi:hypothetical protein
VAAMSPTAAEEQIVGASSTGTATVGDEDTTTASAPGTPATPTAVTSTPPSGAAATVCAVSIDAQSSGGSKVRSLFFVAVAEVAWVPSGDQTQQALAAGEVPQEAATQIGSGNTMNGYRGDLPGE